MASAKRIVCIIVIIVIVVIGVVCTFWLYHKKKKHKIPTNEPLKMEGGVEFYEQVLFSQLIKFRLPNLNQYNKIHFEFSENWNKQHLIKSFISGAKLFNDDNMYCELDKRVNSPIFRTNTTPEPIIVNTRRFVLINYQNLRELISVILTNFGDSDKFVTEVQDATRVNARFDQLVYNKKIADIFEEIRKIIADNITDYHVIIINLTINDPTHLSHQHNCYCQKTTQNTLNDYNNAVYNFINNDMKSYNLKNSDLIDSYLESYHSIEYTNPVRYNVYKTHPLDDCVIDHKLMSLENFTDFGLKYNDLYKVLKNVPFPVFQIHISGCGVKFNSMGTARGLNYATILYPNSADQVYSLADNLFSNWPGVSLEIQCQNYMNTMINNYTVFDYINNLHPYGIYYYMLNENNTFKYAQPSIKTGTSPDLTNALNDTQFGKELWDKLQQYSKDQKFTININNTDVDLTIDAIKELLNKFRERFGRADEIRREKIKNPLDQNYTPYDENIEESIKCFNNFKGNIPNILILLFIAISRISWKPTDWKNLKANAISETRFKLLKYARNYIFNLHELYKKNNTIDANDANYTQLKEKLVVKEESMSNAYSLISKVTPYEKKSVRKTRERIMGLPRNYDSTSNNTLIINIVVILSEIYMIITKKIIANSVTKKTAYSIIKEKTHYDTKGKKQPIYLYKTNKLKYKFPNTPHNLSIPQDIYLKEFVYKQ